MTNILTTSKQKEEEIKKMVRKDTPSYRQAYSDRTAWVMACLSELVYLKFNPSFNGNETLFRKGLSQLNFIDEKKKANLSKISKFIDMFGYDHKKEKEKLEEELNILDYKIIDTFDNDGTQAILVKNDKHIVLAFRGTEKTCIKDIRTDCKAVITSCDSGGNIHSGFSEAFEKVQRKIETALDKKEVPKKPLFITGHSLGGALATIAAKKITHKWGNAACYTFGSPRVGDEEWISNIKTPMYRLVNSADCVTMFPPSKEVIDSLSWLSGFIPKVGTSIRKYLLSKFGGYSHCGNMRYLTNAIKRGDYQKVKLLYSVTWFRRIKALFIKRMSFKKLYLDHSITVYRKKLLVIAQNRNFDKKDKKMC